MTDLGGNLALEVGLLAREAGLGFSRFVSLGNQADLEAADLIEALVEHDGTKAIALYVEDFRDGRAFARAASAARARGKPVVLLALDRTDATARAARSHTGALASESAAVAAACLAAGVERVRTPRELVDVVQGLVRGARPKGRRLAVLADGGGHGAIAASLAASAGLELPELDRATVAALEDELPVTAACSNPIDLAGGAEQDIRTFARASRILLESPEIDALLMTGYFGGYAEYSDVFGDAEVAVGEALARAAAAAGRTMVVQTMYPRTPGAEALRRGDVADVRLDRAGDRGARPSGGLRRARPAADPRAAVARGPDRGARLWRGACHAHRRGAAVRRRANRGVARRGTRGG